MPDWFYRTVSRPILDRFPARTARAFALGFMGRLARLPLGGEIIDLLGHMRADPRLGCSHLGTRFPSPIGLGPGLDVEAVALPALARFGVGFIHVGPIAPEGPALPPQVERDDLTQTIRFPNSDPPLGIAAALPRLQELSASGLPVLIELTAKSPDELQTLIDAVESLATFLAVPVRFLAQLHSRKPILPVISDLGEMAQIGESPGAVISGALPTKDGSGFEIGATAHHSSLELVRSLRQRFGPDFTIIARGGVHEVADALALREAGADLIEVDSGLVFTGPGLVKAINEAFLVRIVEAEPEPASARPATRSWFWTLLMGLGMSLGSLLALGIAATRVVLPYDEQFVGMTCDQLREVNPKLLPFMAHDRVTLAGTMVALGIMYVGLSLGAIRRGQHWAQVAVIASASLGFATFFFFLGFGYLDVLHAFVTGILFQFLLLSIYAELGPNRPPTHQPIKTNGAWSRGLWGQLLLILHACGMLGAGMTIGGFGMTVVFVPEDLEFMRTTADAIRSANPKLIPLIAHDRATFGGMLICFAVVQLLTCLWGLRANQRWLWWTMTLAGIAGYAPAIAVHYAVGYTDLGHLLPAFGGLALYLFGMILLKGFMCSQSMIEEKLPAVEKHPE